MDAETRAAFIAHVNKLQRLAVECQDMERREDAIRSLGCMALLIGDPVDPRPRDTAEIVVLAERLKLAA